jgi:hypothetical protein
MHGYTMKNIGQKKASNRAAWRAKTGQIRLEDPQRVLAQPHWQGRLTPRDYAALTPLIWEHVNPYGRFELDTNTRLALL